MSIRYLDRTIYWPTPDASRTKFPESLKGTLRGQIDDKTRQAFFHRMLPARTSERTLVHKGSEGFIYCAGIPTDSSIRSEVRALQDRANDALVLGTMFIGGFFRSGRCVSSCTSRSY